MGDLIDDANQTADIYLKSSMTWKRTEGPAATGRCLNCETLLILGGRWCDAECRDDWAKREGARDVLPEQQRTTEVSLPQGTEDDPAVPVRVEPEPPKNGADLEAQGNRAGIFE